MNRAILPFAALLLLAPPSFAKEAPAPVAAAPLPAVTVTLPVAHATTPDIMAYSPDGRFLLTGDYIHQIKLWDVATGELIRTYAGHTDSITALTFSADGAYFASASDDKTVRIWNVATGKNVNTLTEHTASVEALAFSPDGLQLASGDDDGNIIVQDFSSDAKGERKATVNYPVVGLKIDPAADMLVAVSHGDIDTFQLATMEKIKTFGPAGLTVAPAFVTNSTRVLIPTYDGALSLWDYKKAALVLSFAMTPKRNAWAFTFPDGKRFLTGAEAEDDDSGETIVWNGQTGIQDRRIDFGDDIDAIAPDGKTVALGGRGGIWIEDAETGAVIRTFGNRTMVSAFENMTADGAMVLSTYPQHDNMILWNLDTGADVRTFDGGGVAAISPDGTRIVGSQDRKATGAINVWDADSGDVLATFNVGAGTIRGVDFSADGKVAVIRVGDTLRTLDMTTLDTIVTGPKVEDATTFAVSPDGKSYAVGDRDGVVTVGAFAGPAPTAPTAKPAPTLFAGLKTYARLAFSPDGKSLLGADEAGSVVLWNVKTGKAAKTLAITGTTNTAVGFSSDGAFIYVAGRDGGLRLWNLKSGKALAPFMHDVDPDLVRFSKDGKTLTTVLNNGTAWRWSLKTGALQTTTARMSDGSAVTMTPEGFLDGDAAAADIRLVRNLNVFPLGNAAAQLVRPGIVAAKIAGDEATVNAAAKKLDLNAALDGATPSDGATSDSGKPTHVVIARAMLHEKADAASAEGDELTPGMQVAVVEADGAWTLVARDGQPIGFVASDAIVPLH